MMDDFLRGVVAMGFLVAAGFFLRFWRESRDRLFALFAAAFMLLAFNRVLLVILHEQREASLSPHIAPYLLRLLAFVIILVAIVDKNVRRA